MGRAADLTYRSATGEDCSVKLSRRVFRIGRLEDNDLVLDNPYISRYHAEVLFDGEEYTLFDLDSTSGTFVNGRRVTRQLLSDGEVIRLGKARGVEFVFHSVETEDDEQTPETFQTIRVMAPEDARFINTAMLPSVSELASPTVERLRSLYEFTSQSLTAHSPEELCDNLAQFLTRALKTERCAVLLCNRDRDVLEVAASHSSDDGQPVTPSKGIASRVFSDNLAILSIDASVDARFAANKSVQLQAIRSVMAAPIGSSTRVWGVSYVDSITANRIFDEEELDFLAAVSRQAGLALENLHLLDEQRHSLESFIRTLSASIGARDDMTAGHSARVGSYSSAIARRMGLSSADCRLIYYAGLLHDYGKIGIRDDVLLKPAELTAEEYEHIKEHPLHTFRILSKIRFPSDLADIPMVAAAHHERWDGTGYPHGLKGEEIPLGSRIVCVADAYDALVEERPYHEGVEPEEALREIEDHSGSYFDPKVVEVFTQYFFQELAPKLRRKLETMRTGD